MSSEQPNQEQEESNSLMERFFAAISAAAALKYTQELHAQLAAIREGTIDPSCAASFAALQSGFDVANANLPAALTTVAMNREAKYTALMCVIGEIRECIGPACARSRYSMERLKRLISRARNLVRECLIETERLLNY